MTQRQPAARVTRLALNVSDPARLEDFYCAALGFERVTAPHADSGLAAALGLAGHAVRAIGLRLGHQRLDLSWIDPPGAPYPRGGTAHDPWFQHMAIVVADMDAAYARLSRFAMTPISQGGPQTLPPSSGGVTAFKFRDPDGHPLELLAFPPGASAKWPAAAAAEGSLGIDHTAIVVADTAASVAFYRALGFATAHASVNWGPEQQRLDATADVEVVVTALHAGGPADMGVELLEYRSTTGRRAPVVASPQDLVATRLGIAVDDVTAVVDAVPRRHRLHGDGETALLADPDCHLIVLHRRQPPDAV